MKKLLPVLAFVLFCISCKKEKANVPSTLDASEIQLHYDESHQFKFDFGTQSRIDLAWSNIDERVGTVDANGLFTAKKIGETTISANGIKCRVKVIPYSNLCKEPFLIFGSSMDNVYSMDKREYIGENATSMAFKGENDKLTRAVYVFENNKLIASGLFFASVDLKDEAEKFLRERYTYLGISSDGYILFTNNISVVVGLSSTAELGLHALYYPFEKETAKQASLKAMVKGINTNLVKSSSWLTK